MQPEACSVHMFLPCFWPWQTLQVVGAYSSCRNFSAGNIGEIGLPSLLITICVGQEAPLVHSPMPVGPIPPIRLLLWDLPLFDTSLR